MLKRLDNLRTKLNQRLDRRIRNEYYYHDLQFVNAVLKELGKNRLSNEEYNSLVDEIRNDGLLAHTYEQYLPYLNSINPHKAHQNWAKRFELAGGKLLAGVNIFYVLPRVLRPTILVETGTAAGSMTSFLLAALNKNQHGQLFSVDLPPQEGKGSMGWSLEKDMEVGFLIPPGYKARWSLVVGDATYELPKIFQNHNVDYFFHDSDHTFIHMIYEYSLAAKHLKSKTILVSDDISLNEAFPQYCQ